MELHLASRMEPHLEKGTDSRKAIHLVEAMDIHLENQMETEKVFLMDAYLVEGKVLHLGSNLDSHLVPHLDPNLGIPRVS
jgi:hypothetical protein